MKFAIHCERPQGQSTIQTKQKKNYINGIYINGIDIKYYSYKLDAKMDVLIINDLANPRKKDIHYSYNKIIKEGLQIYISTLISRTSEEQLNLKRT